MQRLLRTTTVAALTAGLALATAPAADADPPVGVQVIAHRGSVDTAPESTLAAMDQAVADRADRVTIDVRMTRDGVPVVVHDTDLRRTTDAEQKLPRAGPLGGRRPDAGAGQDGRRRQLVPRRPLHRLPGAHPRRGARRARRQPHRHDPRGEEPGGLRRRGRDRRDREAGAGRAPRVVRAARGRVPAPGRGELRLGLPGPHAPDLSRPAAGAPRQRRDADGRDRPGVGPRDRRTSRQPHRRDREPGPRPRHLRRDLDRQRPC